MNFPIGSVVLNLDSVAAVVVGVWNPASIPDACWNWPILRELGRDGKAHGGKWPADPAKTVLIGATPSELIAALDAAELDAKIVENETMGWLEGRH